MLGTWNLWGQTLSQKNAYRNTLSSRCCELCEKPRLVAQKSPAWSWSIVRGSKLTLTSTGAPRKEGPLPRIAGLYIRAYGKPVVSLIQGRFLKAFIYLISEEGYVQGGCRLSSHDFGLLVRSTWCFLGWWVFCCKVVGWLKASRKRMVVCQLGIVVYSFVVMSIWMPTVLWLRLLNTYNWWSTSRMKFVRFYQIRW